MNFVSVIIVNRDVSFLKRCLDSVYQQTYEKIEVILIDNASSDGSVEFVTMNYPATVVVRNSVNEGFCKGNNRGFALAKGEYIMLLNADVYLKPTYVSELVKAVESSNKIGSSCGKLLRMKLDGTFTNIIDSAGIQIGKNRNFLNLGSGEADRGQYDTRLYVFGVPATACLCRREMLDDIKIGGEYFDEAYFMYFEDADLSWRSQLFGWKCIYTPVAVGYHIGGSFPDELPHRASSRTMDYLLFRNRYLTMIKNDIVSNCLHDLFHLAMFEIKQLVNTLCLRPYRFRAISRLLRLLPYAISRRRLIQERRVVSAVDMRHWFS
ncbi:MAG: glycosyltransferase family 2 protein [bacterium]|nr:glycosyltransferase family 2 protein [bacterium]